jgi:lambda family phage portal protein
VKATQAGQTSGKKSGFIEPMNTLADMIGSAATTAAEAVSRTAGRIKAKYDAAGMGRRLAGWMPTSSGPNRAIEGLQNIRNRARDVGRNDWAGESGVQKWTTNLVGIGITPRFKRIKDKARKQQVVDLWNDFVADADADNVLDLYGLQTLAVRSWLESGEVFIRRRRRFVESKHPVPLQIQLLEADMVPLIDEDQRIGMPEGNIIRSGIELNKRGQRVAYWFYKDHPGDGGTYVNSMELIRVLASDVLHIFEPKRPGQLRGVSMLAAVMVRLKNIGDYEDATLERQKLANLFVGFLSRSLPKAPGEEDVDPLTGEVVDWGAGQPPEPLPGLRPGLLAELGDGEKIDWSNPPEAGTNYGEYMRTSHLGTAAGGGLPYELFSGDIANVSDRTLRIIVNEFRRHAEQRQWQIIIPKMCQPVVSWFVQSAVLAGLIGLDEAEDVRRVEHAPHGWSHIHPVQDPAGKKIEVDNGFRSRASVIGGRGDDPDDVDDEIAADDARQQSLKIGPYSKAVQKEKEKVDV